MAELMEPTPSGDPREPVARTQGSVRESVAVFLAAAGLLPFANGGHSILVAAFFAPLLLLRFTRRQRPVLGSFILVAQSIAFAIQFRGMIPVPGAIHTVIVLIYASALTVPYVADRLIGPRLRGWSATLVFPCAWASTDYLLSLSPYGSWGTAAYSLHGNLPLLQTLAVTGLWGLAFLIGWVAAAANRVWELGAPRSPRALRAAGVTAAVVTLVALLGGARLVLFPPDAPTVRIASLSRIEMALHPDPKVVGRFFRQQPLTPEEVATIRSRAATIANDLLERSEREAGAGARIVFWGEANAPVLAEDESDLIRRGREVAKRSEIYLGMALAGWHRDARLPLANKLVVIGPDGSVAWEYYKAHPVPGGEAAMSITTDGKLRALDTPFGRLTSVICFDADFPQLLAQAGELQADIVLDPSNDWKAIDPWHTQMAGFGRSNKA